jgi:hypothetical protein
MATRMQQRRGTSAEWSAVNPILAAGEVGVETDTLKFKIGNGTSSWSSLKYFVNIADIVDGAPETLDTFNELATAIGNDPNFSNTVNSNITAAINAIDTDDIEEGSSNLYFTNQRALDATNSAYDAAGAAATAESNANDYTDSAVAGYAPLAGATFSGPVFLNSDPGQALQAATKQYVDSVSEGIIARPSVKAATTTNLSGTYDNGVDGVGSTFEVSPTATLNIDGVTSWSIGDGLLIKNQTSKFQNGRYVLTTLGDGSNPWVFTRCGLCDEADEIPGSYIFVTDGSSSGQTAWVLHVDDPEMFVVGTDDIDVFQFAGAGTYTAGLGLQLDATQFSLNANINDLLDVDTTGVLDGEALVYDNATSSWIPGEAGSSFAVSETAPSSPQSGDVWFNSATGKTYIYYIDLDTEQWVEIAGAQGPSGPAGPTGPTGPTGATGPTGSLPVTSFNLTDIPNNNTNYTILTLTDNSGNPYLYEIIVHILLDNGSALAEYTAKISVLDGQYGSFALDVYSQASTEPSIINPATNVTFSLSGSNLQVSLSSSFGAGQAYARAGIARTTEITAI